MANRLAWKSARCPSRAIRSACWRAGWATRASNWRIRVSGCAPDVYATHGHYLDCHSGLRTFECFARAVSERVVLRGVYAAPEDYETVLAPLYRLFYRVAQWSWAWQACGWARRS